MANASWPTGLSEADLAEHLTNGFGETLMATLGIELVAVSERRVLATMPVGTDVRALMGGVHAGALCSLADTAATFAAMAARGGDASMEHFPLGVGLSAQIVGNVQEGVVTAESVVTHPGRTLMTVETRVTSDTGRLMGIVTMTHFVRG
ncbi:MAG: PaaI family thioesterase [Chloroflexi bacterium]|nr:PaaI family thioesterase [Chloroflexota bacterium]